MKTWKAALGVGAACAVCCAVPLASGIAAFGIGTTALAAAGSTLVACVADLAPWAAVAIGVTILVTGVMFWRKRVARSSQTASDCRVACPTGSANACECRPGAGSVA